MTNTWSATMQTLTENLLIVTGANTGGKSTFMRMSDWLN